MQSGLFAFPDGLLPEVWVCLLSFRHHCLSLTPFEYLCGEPVGEGERSRLFPLPFLFKSRMNAHASPMNI